MRHNFWDKTWDDHARVMADARLQCWSSVDAWVSAAITTVNRGGKIMFCGNGGSAADAQHIAAELSVKLKKERDPIPALCLSLDPSAMTACANDFGYERIFSRQVEALGKKGDMLVGLSTSGNSQNVIQALADARRKEMTTIGITGMTGGAMRAHCDLLITVPSDDTARIQEMTIILGHVFCGLLETELGMV